MRICTLFFMLCTISLHAAENIWSGSLHSDGAPSATIPLQLNEKYQIKVSGFVNLGKWVQNREKLANDACFEFNNEGEVEKIQSFRNSNDISVCDGKYRTDHVYTSEPFIAKQNKIHFWVYDTDYHDNTGEFKIDVLRITENKPLLAN